MPTSAREILRSRMEIPRMQQLHSGIFSLSAYRYLAVLTFTPGPMVDTTVQDLIY